MMESRHWLQLICHDRASWRWFNALRQALEKKGAPKKTGSAAIMIRRAIHSTDAVVCPNKFRLCSQQRFPLRENRAADLLGNVCFHTAAAQIELLAIAAFQKTFRAVLIAIVSLGRTAKLSHQLVFDR